MTDTETPLFSAGTDDMAESWPSVDDGPGIGGDESLIDRAFQPASGSSAFPDDPEAPYGRKGDGTPYKVPPEQRARLSDALKKGRAIRNAGTGKTAKKTASSAPRAARSDRGQAKAESPAARRYAAARDILFLPVLGLSIAGATLSPAFTLDAMAVQMHSGALAEGAVEFAEKNAWLARVLDRWTEISPAAALATAVGGLVIQMAANHKVVSGQMAAQLGAMPPEQLKAMMSPEGAGDGGDVQPG